MAYSVSPFNTINEWVFGHAVHSVAVLMLVVPLFYIVINEFIRYSARLPGISGPVGFPLVGNLWSIRKNAAEQYRIWSLKYGDVYQVSLGNVPIIIVNSAEAARGLFGQHTSALSSRPEFYTFHKVLTGTATTVGTTPYSESLKRRRKVTASALNRPSAQKYASHLDLETQDFCRDLLAEGEWGKKAFDCYPCAQRLSLSLALTTNWGIRLDSRDDRLFNEVIEVEDQVSRFRSVTGNLQDYIPLLRLNPFNQKTIKAKATRRRQDAYLDQLNQSLLDRMEKGAQSPCIQEAIINDPEIQLSEEEVTSINLTMISGGLDTVTTALAWLIAVLSKRPDIQETAYRAIREVYPAESPFCDANDDQKIPYIVALVKEGLRMYTVLRLNLPRTSIKEVSYNGMSFPKGTTFFLNAHACNMDPKLWHDPELFRPSRWLEQPDAPLFTYGIGYRMCAGFLLANRELYLIIMRLISCFKITLEGDVDIDPVRGTADPTKLVAQPHRFQVAFVPRDEKLLQKALEEFTPIQSK
ncbi:3-hydroxyphenylacetate 6-hydroxylase [Cladophialophora psammophila CBS 110553]|uniref:3-hydroxyphenylacetate 6-hydroxylase n=1 Tax=Cladophialophora psammophila CBS 110553 TaxID=1182543 RepID=W9X4S0_9EURO|nr:3-hydroxyphenylacetate 6-hydroxylase [Cladophialophora psammophila CBS 110553]EXJ75497.1 3-hydroxyphenylacetate 6-hydroxylase [Cladophialophora psammophila CBS 110553]